MIWIHQKEAEKQERGCIDAGDGGGEERAGRGTGLGRLRLAMRTMSSSGRTGPFRKLTKLG